MERWRGLASFNQQNIEFRRYIQAAIQSWIDVGVDALRVDTLKHMPLWIWQEFSTDMKAHKPGMFLFGEYGFSQPWEGRSVPYANHNGMSTLDFALCDGIRFAFSGQEPGGFHQLQRILDWDHIYRRANELVTFIDNHDMPRLLSLVPDRRSLELAIVLLFSLRGVPCVFSGTEQYLHNHTDSGQDPDNRPKMESWDTDSPHLQLTRKLSDLRRRNQAFSFGSHQQRDITDDVDVFKRHYRDVHGLAVINKGPATWISVPHTGLPDGYHPCQLGGRTITGSCPELGGWDHSQSSGLEDVDANTWIGEVPFERCGGERIHHKFLVRRTEADALLENLTARRFVLPEAGRVTFDGVWGAL